MERKAGDFQPCCKVMAAHKPQVQTHAAVAYIPPIGQDCNNMSGPRTPVGNFDQVNRDKTLVLYQSKQPSCLNVGIIIGEIIHCVLLVTSFNGL